MKIKTFFPQSNLLTNQPTSSDFIQFLQGAEKRYAIYIKRQLT